MDSFERPENNTLQLKATHKTALSVTCDKTTSKDKVFPAELSRNKDYNLVSPKSRASTDIDADCSNTLSCNQFTDPSCNSERIGVKNSKKRLICYMKNIMFSKKAASFMIISHLQKVMSFTIVNQLITQSRVE